MGLRIDTLGAFRICHDEEPIPEAAWKAQKHKALLKILLTHRGHALTKEQLMEWLWPDLPPKSAARDLRIAVSQVRRVLEPNISRGSESTYVLTTESGYAWNIQSDYWLDAQEFETKCAALTRDFSISQLEEQIAQAEEAKVLYQGDYLEEDRYKEWTLAERERLKELYLTLLTQLAKAHSRMGRYGRAVELSREALTHDPCRENIWRELMRYHYHAGERTLAIQAYNECQAILDKELGVEPLPETSALHQQILKREVPELPRAVRHNLPQQFTRFIGRDEELEEISQLLVDPDCRWVTLVGPGGIGKTRLALQAVRQNIDRFPDGVAWVPLASLDSPAHLVPTAAHALQLTLYEQEDPKDQLINYLHERRMLLLVDNFEHLLEGVRLLSEILQGAPQVKLLVTSREALKLEGERILEVRGLKFPESETTKEAESYSAVQLFLESARRVHTRFTLSHDEKPSVNRICQLVEGMPLAIELASAWVRLLSCEEIAQEIEKNLDLLATYPRDEPARYRGLRAVFEHSWKLLSQEEREVFKKLSVFQGGGPERGGPEGNRSLSFRPSGFGVQISSAHALLRTL